MGRSRSLAPSPLPPSPCVPSDDPSLLPNFSFERVTVSLEPQAITSAAPVENQLSHNCFILTNARLRIFYTLTCWSLLTLLSLAVTHSIPMLYIIKPQTSKGSGSCPVFNGRTMRCQTSARPSSSTSQVRAHASTAVKVRAHRVKCLLAVERQAMVNLL